MSASESRAQLSAEQALQLAELTERALTARSLENLAEDALPAIADRMRSRPGYPLGNAGDVIV
jgi:hypothetical protein